MIKIINYPFVGGGPYRQKELCANRTEALHLAEKMDKLGRNPIIQRPMPGTKSWFVWYKI